MYFLDNCIRYVSYVTVALMVNNKWHIITQERESAEFEQMSRCALRRNNYYYNARSPWTKQNGDYKEEDEPNSKREVDSRYSGMICGKESGVSVYILVLGESFRNDEHLPIIK